MKKVCVLMSSYNGEHYIRQQIDSILEQQNVLVNLIVRDDGSQDSTRDILNEYQDKGLLRWYTGENLKPAKSFMHLLLNAPNSQYYSFADQDDIWYPMKLYTAVKAIYDEEVQTSFDEKILYVCNKNVVDKDGQHKYYSEYQFRQSASLAFLECHSSGCCMVMNLSLRNYICTHQPKEWIMLHDYWVYLVSNSIGKVIFDNTPMMSYRIHGGNAAGIDEVSIMTKIRRLFCSNDVSCHASDIASSLLQSCGNDMSISNFELVDTIRKSKKNLWTRIYMVLSSDYTIVGGNFKQKVYAKLKILFKKMV